MAILRKFILVSCIIFCAVAVIIVLHASVTLNASHSETGFYDPKIVSNDRSSRSIFSTHDENMDMIPFWATKVPYNKTYDLFLNAYTAIITETSSNKQFISIIVHLHKRNESIDLACGTMNWIKRDAIRFEFKLSSNNVLSSPLKMSHSSYAFCYLKLEGYLSNNTDISNLRLLMGLNEKLYESDVIKFKQLSTEVFAKDNISACTGPLFGSISATNAKLWLQNLHNHGIDAVHFYHRDNFTDTFRNINGRVPKIYHHRSKLVDHMMSHAYYDQNIWYAHCWLVNSHRTKWIINIDMDEYLTINNHRHNKLSDYVSDLAGNIGVINIPRVRYRSCNGIIPLMSNQPTLELMSCRSELGLEFQKSMYRPGSISNLDVHLLDIKDRLYTVGKKVTWKNNHEFIIDAYDGVLIKHVSPILSNQLYNNHNAKELLIDEKPRQGDGSLIFQIVKCSNKPLTLNISSHFFPVHNLCYNRGKMDSIAKLKILSQYCLKMSKTTLSDKYVLLFLDGDEEIINGGISTRELQSRWESFQSSILISTESTCMLGEACSQVYNDSSYQYNGSTSIYTGSSVMGSPKVLYNTLSNLLDHNTRLQLGVNNMNYAFHALAFDKATKSDELVIKLDFRQSIFGSMTYTQTYSKECNYLSPLSKYLKNKYYCYDQVRLYHHPDCCTNYDISWKMLVRMFKVFSDTDSTYKCTVTRSSGLKDNSMRLGAPYFFRNITSSLQHVPFVWTGHGPGKLIFSSLLSKVTSCHMDKTLYTKAEIVNS